VKRGAAAAWVGVAAVWVSGAACGGPYTIDISGTVFDFEAYMTAVALHTDVRAAYAAAALPGVVVFLAEDSQRRSLTTGADGRYLVPDAPARIELHPVATRTSGYLRTEDGIGVQFAESDVTGYPIGILPRGPLVHAIANGLSMTVDALQEQGFQLFAIFDDAFPSGAPLVADVAVSINLGAITFVGWNATSRTFATAGVPSAFGAETRWLGLLAITAADGVEVRAVVQDQGRGPGRPKIFVQHPMPVEPGRATLFLLAPVN